MTVSVCTSQAIATVPDFDCWLATTGSVAKLPQDRRVENLGSLLEKTFTSIREEWWDLGNVLSSTHGGYLAHMPTAAAYNSDFGLMLTWLRLAQHYAGQDKRYLFVCDDPWLFRALEMTSALSADRPSVWRERLKLFVRGYLARTRVAVKALIASVVCKKLSNNRNFDKAILVYGHPESNAKGYDAYFGDLMQKLPNLTRVIHTDCPAREAQKFVADGRTASLHAWGSAFTALLLPFKKWRLNRPIRTAEDWLVQRAVAKENGGGVHAANFWQMHCQKRWLQRQRPKTVVWPWENHPWERAFCRETKNVNTRAIGYQQTVIGKHQFNFSPRTNCDGTKSLPDRIIGNGPAYLRQLKELGISPDMVHDGGAFRISRQFNCRYVAQAPLFVALSAIPEIAHQMMSELPGGTKCLVKEHPLYPFEFAETEFVKRTTKPMPDHESLSGVFYATGTSGVEALLAGMPCFRLQPLDRVAIDVMPAGIGPVDVEPGQLAGALKSTGSPQPVTWESIYSPVNYSVWSEELGEAG